MFENCNDWAISIQVPKSKKIWQRFNDKGFKMNNKKFNYIELERGIYMKLNHT